MRTICLSVLLTLPSVRAAVAQDPPRIEAFFGYTYTRFPAAADQLSCNTGGVSGQFVYDWNRYFGAVADIGFVHTSAFNSTSFLFGPRLATWISRFHPYAQVLWGGTVFTGNFTAFGFASGAGLDIRVSRHLSLRPAELDYYLTRLNQNNWNNLRYTAGCVLTFGAQ